jgi:hypothetical protein
MRWCCGWGWRGEWRASSGRVRRLTSRLKRLEVGADGEGVGYDGCEGAGYG